MIDEKGYRSNVGIVLLNKKRQVFLGKRKGIDAWQLPQGGIIECEQPHQAMIRELKEETGVSANHITVLGNTKQWLYYDVPSYYIRNDGNLKYKGQKQIWYLVKFLANDSIINLESHIEQEFDDWMWVEYWDPIERIVEFKQQVYQLALNELFIFIGKA